MSVIAERPVFVFLARFVPRHASFNCRSVIIDWPLIGVWREILGRFLRLAFIVLFTALAPCLFCPFLFFIYSTVWFSVPEFQMANYSVDVKKKQNRTLPPLTDRVLFENGRLSRHTLYFTFKSRCIIGCFLIRPERNTLNKNAHTNQLISNICSRS